MRALNGIVSDNSLNIVNAEDTKVINIGKALVANAITEKGVAADKNDSFATLSKKIDKIETGDKTGCYVKIIRPDITNITTSYSRIVSAEVIE